MTKLVMMIVLAKHVRTGNRVRMIPIIFGMLIVTFAFTNVHAQFVDKAAYAQAVDRIVGLHVTALGGAEKLKAVKSITSEHNFDLQSMEVPSKSFTVVGRSYRTESLIMGNQMVQVLNGDKGWKIMPSMLGGSGEPEDLSSQEMVPLIANLDPFGALHGYREKGSTIQIMGAAKVGGTDTIHLKVTEKSGAVIDEFLDAKTYLRYKSVSSVGGQDNEMIFSDYQDFNGIKFPRKTEIISPMGAFTLAIRSIVVNGKIDPQIFVKPKN